MQDLLRRSRIQFLKAITDGLSSFNGQLIILTHALPDRAELLAAFERIGEIALVIAVPYSIDKAVLDQIAPKYRIITPTLEELSNEDFLLDIVRRYVSRDRAVAIVEIGGYFAEMASRLQRALEGRLTAIIEDTEAGHRKYAALKYLPCPVFSAARSPLKAAEDSLVGVSCIFSVEKVLRKAGILLEPRRSLVLGYGKVGRGLAQVLYRRHCPLMVYDCNPIKRTLALGEGFPIPARATALANANIVFGATGHRSVRGRDFALLNSGTILVSCSSRNVEFEVEWLQANYSKTTPLPNLDRFELDGRVLYLLAGGYPVNFVDGAVIGPLLSLAHAELIVALSVCCSVSRAPGLYELTEEQRLSIADLWIEYFCESTNGFYQQG